jgi:hypothetical protein
MRTSNELTIVVVPDFVIQWVGWFGLMVSWETRTDPGVAVSSTGDVWFQSTRKRATT